ncbi:hypothetical protein [Arthrobacter sp. G119Y2]|uniref:hypothetical protein n=1 Tax=Arthrobacter sp. G119Y2 TaxID=3134965 RepID=UPI00311A37B2
MSEQTPQENNYNYNAYTGGQTPDAPAAPVRPKQVEISFWLLIASLLISVVSVPLTIAAFNSPESRAETEAELQRQNVAGLTVDDAIAATVAFLVITAVISVAITLLVAIFIRKGHNWARIVLTVFAVLSLLSLLVPSAATALGIAGMVLILAAAVLLYVTPAPAYFAAMKQYRHAKKFGQAY